MTPEQLKRYKTLCQRAWDKTIAAIPVGSDLTDITSTFSEPLISYHKRMVYWHNTQNTPEHKAARNAHNRARSYLVRIAVEAGIDPIEQEYI